MYKTRELPILNDEEYNEFWKLSNRDNHTDDGCWLWLGKYNNFNRPIFKVNGGWWLAHRLSYELRHGRIPKNYDIHHVCENKSCINPSEQHLEALSQSAHAKRHNELQYDQNAIIKDLLTDQQKQEILELWDKGEMYQHQIASKFDVKPAVIRKVIDGKF